MLAVIPARGGSKRIPRKNVREVAGKPLIAHTVEQAKRNETFEEVVVSTDDREIGEVASSWGANVPFYRPPELATDEASTDEVISHVLDWYVERDRLFESVCLLQVTTPLRSDEDVKGAIEMFDSQRPASLVTVSQFSIPPQFALRRDEDGTLIERFDPPKVFTDEYVRSQDLEGLLYPNGALYLATTDAWCEYERFYTPETLGYEMPPIRSIDIDEEWELELVECLLQAQR